MIALLALLLQVPPPPPPAISATAPTPPPLHVGSKEMVCPVGGESFPAQTTLMYSIMGRRPDEKPYSEIPFPRPEPVCPGNGLVVFDTFSPAEVTQLAALIATPEYRAMIATESPFYRGYWLAKRIGRPAVDVAEMLLPAIWEAKEQDGSELARPRTARYQQAFVAEVQALPSSVSIDDRVWAEGQAANALREMGSWSAAEAMRRRAVAELPQTTRPALAVYLRKLGRVIARHDRSDEPLDMIPAVQAELIRESRAKARRD